MKRFIFLFLFLLLPLTAEAAIYWTRPTGTMSGCTASDTPPATDAGYKSTITAGNGCLSPGDTLYVRTGTYAEELYANIRSGTSWSAPVTISSAPGETATIRPGVSGLCGSPCRVFTFDVSQTGYIIINGFVIDGVNTLFDMVKINSNHVRITNNELKNSHESGILASGTDHQILNNNIHDNGAGNDFNHGIYWDADGSLIEGNDVHHNSGWGFHLFNQVDRTQVHDNIVRNNTSHHNGTSGTRGAGYLLSAGANNIAYNNISYSNLTDGFQVDFSAVNTQIYNNTIYNNGGGCINTSASSTSGTVATNNICFQNAGGTFTGAGSISTTTNLTTDPLFVNAPAIDFHLQTGSGAIGSGTDLSGTFTTDYANTTRSLPYSIGAYAFTAQNPQLVLALSLDENSGTAPQDSSGFANHGSFGAGVAINSSGKYNRALTFSGGTLTVPDANSLDVTTGFTVEAWVKPTTIDNTWRTVAVKSNAFGLAATSSGTSCGNNAIRGTFNDSLGGFHGLCYGTPLTANVDTHLSLTYDGALFKLYVNGVQVVSQAETGTVAVTTNPLLIGNSTVAEAFAGSLDEVRIYNYARSGVAGSGTCDDPGGTKSEIECDRDSSIGTVIIANAPIKLHANAAAIKCAALAACLKLGQ